MKNKYLSRRSIKAIGVTSCVNCPFGVTYLNEKKCEPMKVYCKPLGMQEVASGFIIASISSSCPLPSPKLLLSQYEHCKRKPGTIYLNRFKQKLTSRLYHYGAKTTIHNKSKSNLAKLAHIWTPEKDGASW